MKEKPASGYNYLVVLPAQICSGNQGKSSSPLPPKNFWSSSSSRPRILGHPRPLMTPMRVCLLVLSMHYQRCGF